VAAQREQQRGGMPDWLVLGVIALLLGVTVLVWTATGLAGLLAHGSWPADVHFTRTPRAMRALVGEPHDMAAAWPDASPAGLPRPGLFWGVFIGQWMVLIVLAVWALGTLARWRRGSRRRYAVVAAPAAAEEAAEPPAVPAPRRRGRTPAGKAEGDGLDAWFRTVPRAAPPGTAPAAPAAPAAEPVTAELPPVGPPPTAALDSGELTRTYALFAGPRGEQAKQVVQPAVLAAAGPVLVTTADPDTYHQTVGNRSKLGPVHVYDPAHVLDVPGRLRWAPHSGCEDPATAAIRAQALLAGLRTARADEAIVHATAVTLLRCWLHAAAVDGRPFRQVHRWAASSSAAVEAVRVLRTDTGAASGWSGELESVLHAHPDRRDAAQALIRRTLEPLNSVHIRDACNPTRTGGLDVESWAAELGTLYVVGERIEDPRTRLGAMPLLTALVSCVVEHGRRMAAGSSAGRLDPPLSFVLDDVAALAPFPALPTLLAEGTATGLPTLAVLRSPEQATARWQTPLWQSADLRVTLDPTIAPAVPDAIRLR
jgi:hypothetical protein